MFTLRTLGGLILEGPSGPVSGSAAQRRRLALLALLGVAGDKGLSRDKLAGYLWPESDTASARHSLSNTIYVLRKALSAELLVASGEFLRLDPEVVWCDVSASERLLEERRFEEALNLYGGAFLDGFYLGGEGEFDRWVEGERQRLAGEYARALESAAEEAETAGQPKRAEEWWKKLVAHDPYNSRVLLRLMEALAAAGDPANALELARVHEVKLREDLGIEPPADFAAAIQRLRNGPVPSRAEADGAAEAPAEQPASVMAVEKAGANEGSWTFRRFVSEVHRRSLWQVLLVYVGGAMVAYQVVQALTEGLNLPSWFPALAVVLFIVGLPIVVATALLQEGGPRVGRTGRTQTLDGSDAVLPPLRLSGMRRLLTWRKAIWSGVIALGLCGVVAVGWQMLQGSRSDDISAAGSAGASGRIIVLPFLFRGDEEYAYLSEAVVELLSRTLDGARGTMRSVDPRSVLGTLENNGGDFSAEQGQSLAERLNASHFVVGDIVQAGDRLRLSARLYDTSAGPEGYRQAAAEGSPREVFGLIDDLTAQLLVALEDPGTRRLIRVSALTTDSLEALKAFLEGERHYRSGMGGRGDAFHAFQRAVEIDSTFALAWLRVSQLGYYSGLGLALVQRAAEKAAEYAPGLPERERLLLEAWGAYGRGAAAESERIYRQLLGDYSEYFEGWFGLDKLYSGYAHVLGISIAERRQVSDRVLRYEPDNYMVLWGRWQTEALAENWPAVDSLSQRLLGDDLGFLWGSVYAFGSGDGEMQERLLADAEKGDLSVSTLFITAWWVSVLSKDPRAALELSELARRSAESPGWLWLIYLNRAIWEFTLGRITAWQAECERLAAHNAAWAIEDAAYLSLTPDVPVSRFEFESLRDSIERWDANAVPPAEIAGPPGAWHVTWSTRRDNVHPHLRLYLLGRLSVRLDDEEAALRYASELDGLATPPEPGGSLSQDLAQSIRAHLLAYQGQTAEALMALDAAPRIVRTPTDPFFNAQQDRFLRATLLEEMGREEEALRWYESLDGWYNPLMRAPAYLRQARIHERLGDRENALKYYSRFIDYWKDADPELQSQVEAARRAMEALAPDK